MEKLAKSRFTLFGKNKVPIDVLSVVKSMLQMFYDKVYEREEISFDILTFDETVEGWLATVETRNDNAYFMNICYVHRTKGLILETFKKDESLGIITSTKKLEEVLNEKTNN